MPAVQKSRYILFGIVSAILLALAAWNSNDAEAKNIDRLAKQYDKQRKMAVRQVRDMQDSIREQLPAFIYYSKASNDTCATGSHNMNVDAPYDFNCAYKLTYVYGIKSDVPGQLAALKHLLDHDGWKLSKKKLGQAVNVINIENSLDNKNENSGFLAVYHVDDMTLNSFVTDTVLGGRDLYLLHSAISSLPINSALKTSSQLDKAYSDEQSLAKQISKDNDYIVTLSITQTYAYKNHLHLPLVGFWIDSLQLQ